MKESIIKCKTHEQTAELHIADFLFYFLLLNLNGSTLHTKLHKGIGFFRCNKDDHFKYKPNIAIFKSISKWLNFLWGAAFNKSAAENGRRVKINC